MPRINLTVDAYKVEIWEYERGWGAKCDEVIYFDNSVEALAYVEKYNSRNTEKHAPDWYTVAEYCGKVR